MIPLPPVEQPLLLVYGATVLSLALSVAMLHLAVQAVPATVPAPERALDRAEVG